jgi:hypothetical protein
MEWGTDMADLFGAPVGFLAAGEEQRANVTNTLGALKTMGDIAQQPVDMALKQAHARYYGAEAGLKEAEAANLQMMAQLEAQFHAQGKNPTVEDLARGPQQPQSQADQLMAMAAFAEDRGAPISITGKMRASAATILEHEAIAGYRNAQQQREAQRTLTERQTRVSNVAATAAESPQAYMTVLQDPELSGLLPRQLTGDWNTDRGVLSTIAKAGQDSIRRARLAQQQQEVGLTAARSQATIANAQASADLAKARRLEVEDRTERIKKNGGERSVEAADAKRSVVEARRAAREAKDRKEFPPMPLDPKLVIPGQSYTGANGTRYTIVGKAANGNPVGRPVAVSAPSTAAPTDDEEED